MNFSQTLFSAAPALLAAIFSFLANINSQKATEEIEKAKLQIDEVKVATSVRAQQSQFDIKAYELVEKTLTIDPAMRKGHGVAAAAIVSALTKPPLRDELINALRAGSTTDTELIEKLDKVRKFEEESPDFLKSSAINGSNEYQSYFVKDDVSIFELSIISPALATNHILSLDTYLIDILYCESTSNNQTNSRKSRAERAQKLLHDNGIRANIRVRLLPTLVQARAEYQSFSDEVRYYQINDKEAAQTLAKIVSIADEPTYIQRGKSSNYITFFYCQ